MSENNVIKISPSPQLKELICNHIKDWESVPERISGVVNVNAPVKKRGGKAALSTPILVESSYLHVEDLNWLYKQVKILLESGQLLPYTSLHKLLQGCEIVLPQPPTVERNPELEARVQRLKREQDERQYKAMTKNVDSVRVHHPDDSIGYQMKMINSHIIAVVQFIVSVGAGFTFGFVGIQLMVGSLDFGFRLLLGVACALTIALAEIYFLAKKLSEDYDENPPPHQEKSSKPTIQSGVEKLHKD